MFIARRLAEILKNHKDILEYSDFECNSTYRPAASVEEQIRTCSRFIHEAKANGDAIALKFWREQRQAAMRFRPFTRMNLYGRWLAEGAPDKIPFDVEDAKKYVASLKREAEEQAAYKEERRKSLEALGVYDEEMEEYLFQSLFHDPRARAEARARDEERKKDEARAREYAAQKSQELEKC